MYSILDCLFKSYTPFRGITVILLAVTHEHTTVLRTTPNELVEYVQCGKGHTYITNHQAHAYLETLMFSQLKRYVQSPRESAK